jgi:5-methylcytosine-specific restriction endonuclease McrA
MRLSEVKKGIIPPNIEILKQSRKGATNSEYQRERVRQANTGLIRSDETKQKISENRTGLYCGAENHAWNGGSSFFPYCPKFNERRKKAVRNFFGNLCLTCTKPASKNLRGEKAVALSVHHIHHNKTEGCHGVPFNLVPLCHDCHNEEQFDQGGYKLRINTILDEGFASGRWPRETYEREVMYPEESNEA